MIAWRVQNDEGQGPYRTDLLPEQWQEHRHGDCECHPEPITEFGLELAGPIQPPKWMFIFLCGFLSKKQCLAWFAKSELKKLEQFGFRLVKVRADGIHCGSRKSKQVIFFRHGQGLTGHLGYQ